VRALRNALLSPGRRLFGPGFSFDYLRFAWRSRRLNSVGPGALTVAGMHVDYGNQSHALLLLHEIFVNAEYDFEPRTARPRIVDCGANIGMAVLFFKARYPDADVLAFEPNPAAFELLKRNIDANRLDSVVAEKAAVTEHSGTATLFRHLTDPSSVVASLDRSWGGDASEEVRAVRLSDRINGTVDFLKLDIEGGEYAVIRDLVNTGVIRWVREAVIEFHHVADQPDAVDRMTDSLRATGFDLAVKAHANSMTGVIRARRL
jgi:FkbM family methyltransferase